MKRSEFLKRVGSVGALAVVAPKMLVGKAEALAPIALGPGFTTVTTSVGGSYFRTGDMIRFIQTGEHVTVTSTAADSVTWQRAIA